jgi:predicted DNA-binding protein
MSAKKKGAKQKAAEDRSSEHYSMRLTPSQMEALKKTAKRLGYNNPKDYIVHECLGKEVPPKKKK